WPLLHRHHRAAARRKRQCRGLRSDHPALTFAPPAAPGPTPSEPLTRAVLRFNGSKFHASSAPGVALRRFRLLFFVLFLAVFAGIHIVRAGQSSGKISLNFVLSMMDKSAKDFHSLTADLEHIKYTAVVK